jgi:hypothetical protein
MKSGTFGPYAAANSRKNASCGVLAGGALPLPFEPDALEPQTARENTPVIFDTNPEPGQPLDGVGGEDDAAEEPDAAEEGEARAAAAEEADEPAAAEAGEGRAAAGEARVMKLELLVEPVVGAAVGEEVVVVVVIIGEEMK